jgi:hypothetical protein
LGLLVAVAVGQVQLVLIAALMTPALLVAVATGLHHLLLVHQFTMLVVVAVEVIQVRVLVV